MYSKEHLLKIRENFRKVAEHLSDDDAYGTPELFELWAVGVTYSEGKRFQYEGELYKVKQGHTSQADWTPDVAVSLYEKVPEPGQGSKDNPIPYSGNMALEEGKYYSQYDVTYFCFRNTGIAVSQALADLVDLYVRVAD